MKAYTDIERSAEFVWPYIWDFKHMKGYIDNAVLDSLNGGDDWYDVKFTGDFTMAHSEVVNHKWIVEHGKKVGTKMISSKIESPLALEVVESLSFWSIKALEAGRCRVYYTSTVKVDMGGMEGLYTGIAKKDSERIMKKFKKYVESN